MPILIIYLSGTPLTLPLASGATVINPAVMMNKPPDRLVMQQFPFLSFFYLLVGESKCLFFFRFEKSFISAVVQQPLSISLAVLMTPAPCVCTDLLLTCLRKTGDVEKPVVHSSSSSS